MKRLACQWMMLAALLATCQLQAQTVAGEILADALRAGGFVIVMRHANSPRELPDAATVNADNVNGERQLDQKGRDDAAALGAALRRLGIAISEVQSSPTYRALETARLAGFTGILPREELGNEGMRDSSAEYAAWLHEQVARHPAEGSNHLLITHGPNINAAFPEDGRGMGEGDALVFDPRGMEGPVLAGRIAIGEWQGL